MVQKQCTCDKTTIIAIIEMYITHIPCRFHPERSYPTEAFVVKHSHVGTLRLTLATG